MKNETLKKPLISGVILRFCSFFEILKQNFRAKFFIFDIAVQTLANLTKIEKTRLAKVCVGYRLVISAATLNKRNKIEDVVKHQIINP